MATVRIKMSTPAAAPSAGAPLAFAATPVAAAASELPRAQSAQENPGLHLLVGVAAVALILAVAGLIVGATSDIHYGEAVKAPIAGLTIFATFYAAAQAIERLLEPISSVLFPKEKPADDYASKLDEVEGKMTKWASVIGNPGASQTDKDAAKQEAEAKLLEAANAKAKLDGRHLDRVISFWAAATILGMWASATLHLYFLKVIGVAGGSRGLEILATGLIIGAGTKPLHDLITSMSAKAEQKSKGSDSENTATTTG
jgi:hypothetical protein